MIFSRKEMTHILGLTKNPFFTFEKNEGWNSLSAYESSRRRYQALTQKTLNFNWLTNFNPMSIKNKIAKLNHGEYIGYLSDWRSVSFPKIRGHTYSFHAMKENDLTHFIYVNRGQRHIDKTGVPSVMVFSIPNAEAKSFAGKMEMACRFGRMGVADFLNKHAALENKKLSDVLTKSNQKVGNCTVANSNMAWHLQLTADYLKNNPSSTLEDAYQHTKSEYKALRRADRIAALQYLVKNKNEYLSEKAFFYDLLEALQKIHIKEQTASKNQTGATLASILTQDPLFNQELGKLLIHPNFDQYVLEHERVYLEYLRKKGVFQNPKFQQLGDEENYKIEYRKLKQEEHQHLRAHIYTNPSSASIKLTSGENLLLSNAGNKDKRISQKMQQLKEALADHHEIGKIFDELCQICCERRAFLKINKYSSNTHSAVWLRSWVEKNPELMKALSCKSAEDVQEKMKNALSLKARLSHCKEDNPSDQIVDKPPITRGLS